MIMFVSFEESELKKAILKEDYYWLKAAVLNTIWNDPTFEHGETEELLEILRNEVPDIFKTEEKVPSEEKEPLDRSLWDKKYFSDLTYYLRENFAESRLAHIKEVGKAVYQKSEQKQAEKENPKSTVAPKKEKTESTNQEKPGNFHLSGMIVAVIILVIVLILLIRNLIK